MPYLHHILSPIFIKIRQIDYIAVVHQALSRPRSQLEDTQLELEDGIYIYTAQISIRFLNTSAWGGVDQGALEH